MNPRYVIITGLAVGLLMVGLTGCRSSRKQVPQQSAVAQRTTPVYPSQPVQPSYPSTPQTTYPAPPPQQPPTPPSLGPTVVPAPTAPYAGGPDGPATAFADPGAFPSQPLANPGPPSVAQGDLEVIAADRRARMELDQRIVDLEETVRQLGMKSSRPAPARATAAPAGGTAQAARFASAIKSKTSGEIEVVGSRVTIRLADAFQPGSEKLKTSASLKATLLATAQELSKYPGARIEVVGHSDGTPLKVTKAKWRDNVHLSTERARTVANALSKHGVAAGRIAVDGRGSVEPLVFPEKTPKDRARNRRVEVLVLF